MNAIELPARRLKVLADADVVVIGGGTAGFVAAIAAARTGAHTVLLERRDFLGGCASATYNTNLSSSHNSDGYRIMGGIGWEFINRMAEAEGAIFRFHKGNRTPAQLFPEQTKTVALRMVHEAGVELYLHTWAGETIHEGGRVRGIVVRNKSGTQVVSGKVFVDCSADADVVADAGGEFEMLPLDDRYTTTLDLTVCNIDTPRFLTWAKAHAEALGISANRLPEDLDRADGLRTMVTVPIKGPRERRLEDGAMFREHRSLSVKLMVRRSICRVQGHVHIDGTDVRQITRAEREGREEALANLAYLREHVPGFEDAFVIAQSPLGVRETRRIIGDYVLSIDDVLSHRRFEDVIGLNCRALDKHEKDDRFYIRMLEGDHDIPLRALLPRGLDNVVVAGRCISSDHESNASLRGGGTCMITGHAAGTAAALASRIGLIRDVPVKQVQQTLRRQGAVLSARESGEPVS